MSYMSLSVVMIDCGLGEPTRPNIFPRTRFAPSRRGHARARAAGRRAVGLRLAVARPSGEKYTSAPGRHRPAEVF